MDYKDFLEFAEDLYSVTHYRKRVREDSNKEEDEEEIVANVSGGGGYGSDDSNLN